MSVVPPERTAEFSVAWEAFFRTVRRVRTRAAQPLDGGLSIAQYHLLEPLRAGSEQTVGDLAEAAGITAPTATRMLDCLAREALVDRRQSEADRRVVLVGLTPAGRTALAAAHERVEAFRRRVHDALEPAERAQAATLLPRLAAVLDRELP